MNISRGFAATLFGIVITALGWFGVWDWPLWPASAVYRLLAGSLGEESGLPDSVRIIVAVLFVFLNIALWGGLAYGASRLVIRTGRPAAGGL